jgi:hypothetical protein
MTSRPLEASHHWPRPLGEALEGKKLQVTEAEAKGWEMGEEIPS